jgi:hypothetical protein
VATDASSSVAATKKSASSSYMSAAAFNFVLPVLRLAVLGAEAGKTESLKQAVAVVVHHCRAGLNDENSTKASFPVASMAELLLHVIANVRSLRAVVRPALLELASSFSQADVKVVLGSAGLLNGDDTVRLACLKLLQLVPSMMPPQWPELVCCCLHDDHW